MTLPFVYSILCLIFAVIFAALYFIEKKQQLELKNQLKGVEEEVRYLLRQGKLGLWYYRSQEKLFMPSAEWFHMMGCEPQQCKGLRDKFYQHISIRDRDRVSQSFAHFIEQKIPVYHEKFLLNSVHGKRIWIEEIGHILSRDDEGLPIKFLGICRDISSEMEGHLSLSKKEGLLQSLASGERVEFWEWDLTDDTIVLDPIFTPLVPHKQGAKYSSKDFFGQIHPDDKTKIDSSVKQFLAGKSGKMVEDFRHLIKDEHHQDLWRWIRVFAVIFVRDDSGHPQKVAGISMDVDYYHQTAERLENDELKLKGLESELKLKEEELNQMSHSLLHSVSTLAREVRSPLNVSLGILENLMERELDDHKHSLLDQLKNASKQIFRIVNEIVDLMRLQTQEFHLENNPVDLKKLLNNLFIDEHSDLQGGFTYPASVSQFVYGDSKRLKQILKDCRDYVLSGNPHTLIRLTVDLIYMDGMPYLSLSLDNPQAARDSQVTRQAIYAAGNLPNLPRTSEKAIGLTIAEKMIKLMEGSLSIECHEELGNCVHMVLPYLPCQVVDEPQIDQVYDRKLLVERKPSILIVDDSEANRELIRIFLNEYPVSIFMAKDGAEAVQLYQREKLDLIIMDIQMPIMDGREAIQIIRSIEKNSHRDKVPIIALSAFIMHEEVDRCLDEGSSSVLVKPVKKGILLDEIVKCLN